MMLYSYFHQRNWGIEREGGEGREEGGGRRAVGEAVLVMQKILEVLYGCVCPEIFLDIWKTTALELDFLIYKEIRQIRKICLSNVLEMQVKWKKERKKR